jgi:Spy/CpxP family protein refolding chaperone
MVMTGMKAGQGNASGGGPVKSRYFRVLAVALALAVIAGIAVSQSVRRAHRYGDGMYGRGMFDRSLLRVLAHQLDLTDGQRAQVKQIMAKERPTLQPLMLQMAQDRKQLRQLVMSGTFDEAKVRELAAEQSQTVTQLTVERARVESELFQILSAEQKTKAAEQVDQHEQRFLHQLQKQAQGQTQSQ